MNTEEWLPPQNFPDLSEAKEIAIDLETCDPNLKTFGPGWPRKDGYIVGYAVAVDGWCGYYPIAHGGGGNLDKKIVESWITEIMLLPCPKVMHNAAYDLGWLWASGFKVEGKIIDTMIAAGLVDENRFSYALNSLGFDMLKEVKSEEGLKKAGADWGLSNYKAELFKLPAHLVARYGEQDAALTLKLWHHLEVLLRQEEVESIFELETEMLPILTEMTFKGIRFDREKAQALIVELQGKEKKLVAAMKKEAGVPVDMWAAASIAKAFDKLGVEYPKTEKGAPSFTKSFLEACEHPLAKMVVEVREVNKTHNTFLQPYLDASEATGRIHSHVSQLRGETASGIGGTVTGRLSMNQPNLQNVPARHPVVGPMVRSLFLPEEGEFWAANDFSAQEPRLLVHYAKLLELEGADVMAQAYHDDPDTDFHQMVSDLCGDTVTRSQAKAIGLGLMYGMGKAKLAIQLDMAVDEAAELIQTFHAKVPFLKGTIHAVQKRIEYPASGGSIRTLLGRKCRFPLWEPMQWGINKALPYEEAFAKYGARIRRAYTYRGLNKILQGGSADQTKKSMIELHKAGYNMLLSVHDEIALSVKTKEEAEAAAEIMKHAVSLEVPSKIDVEVGDTWGSAK